MTQPTVLHAIRAAAAGAPHAIALRSPTHAMTYGELVGRFDGLAHALRARGVGAGTRVAIHLERSPEMIIAILGTLAAGAAYVPLDPGTPRSRLDHILRDCRAATLVSRGDGDALAASAGLPRLDPLDWPSGGPAADHPAEGTAYLMYTSGSTGVPKGVVIDHPALANYLGWAVSALPFTGGGVPLLASVSFDHAVTCYFPPLMKGETLFLLPPLDGGRTLAASLLTGQRYSYVKITPSHARLLDLDQRAALGGSTSLLMFGGEKLTPELIAQVRRDAPDLPVMNHYGPTEATVGCCVYQVPAELTGPGVPIGRPLPGVTACVRRDDLRLAERDELGELWIGGRALASGYWGRPDLTARAFVEAPDAEGAPARWYRTGDIVRARGDGVLEYLGRADDQVKVLGHRIEPAEIERALRQHPQVREAVVLSTERGAAVELIAAVTLVAGPLDEAALRAHLRDLLSPVMIPRRIGCFEQLPVTPSGKLDRAAVLAATAGDAPGSAASAGGNDDPEARIAAKFAELLGVALALDDDFFERGGDSLASVEVVRWVQAELGVPLELSALFKYPTIRTLADRVRHLRT